MSTVITEPAQGIDIDNVGGAEEVVQAVPELRVMGYGDRCGLARLSDGRQVSWDEAKELGLDVHNF